MADDPDVERAEGAQPTGKRRSETNEWTLSDTRGPLGAADTEHAAGEQPPSSEPESSQARSEEFAPSTPTSDALAPAHTSPAQPHRQAVPVLPIIAALVVGAIIGGGSAAVVYKSSDQGASQGDVNALSARVDELARRPNPQPELTRLQSEVDKTAAAAKAQAFDPAPLQQRIAGLESEIDALKKQDASQGLGDKVSALEGSVAGLKGQDADIKALDGKVAGLSAASSDVKGKVAGLAAAVDGLRKDDATTQASLATLQDGQKAMADRAGAPALAVVADSLIQAISRGKPYASQVEAAAALHADPAKVAVLRENADKGVPSAQMLAAKFAPLADPLSASADHAAPGAGLVDRLRSGMLGMVSVRRVDAAASGDDPGSRVSRIEADLAHDDVSGAYAAWDGLPAQAKAKSEAWGALAKTRVEAMSAARALQQQAIAALGTKKS